MDGWTPNTCWRMDTIVPRWLDTCGHPCWYALLEKKDRILHVCDGGGAICTIRTVQKHGPCMSTRQSPFSLWRLGTSSEGYMDPVALFSMVMCSGSVRCQNNRIAATDGCRTQSVPAVGGCQLEMPARDCLMLSNITSQQTSHAAQELFLPRIG
eukprot:scaffold994_cov396-Pavlova_lutheri.AAC.3